MRIHSPLLLLLTACTPDLAEAERRQRALEVDLQRLEQEVETLRGALAKAGVVKRAGPRPPDSPKGSGPRRTGALPQAAHQNPGHDLSASLSVAASRTGTPPILPSLDPPVATKDCGYRFSAPGLRAISDYPLNNHGLGKAGPVLLQMDGTPLTAHAFPATYEQRCGNAFRHAGTAILFSPPPDTKPEDHRFELTLDERVPMPRGDDERPVYWAYPGTTLVITIDGTWDPEWGPARIELVAYVAGQGEVAIDLAGEAFEAGGVITSSVAPEGPLPWTIRIAPTAEDPYVLIEGLTVGNADHALVVTGNQAWTSR